MVIESLEDNPESSVNQLIFEANLNVSQVTGLRILGSSIPMDMNTRPQKPNSTYHQSPERKG